jgi:hypothetical protein
MKEIEFIAKNEFVWNVWEKPKPASNFLPDWWKKMPSGDETLDLNPGLYLTVKKCMPTLDILSAGYIVTLCADVKINIDEKGNHYGQWLHQQKILDTWDNHQVLNFELLEEYNTKPVFKYLHGWNIKTPNGWSCYFTHPIGYPNLPFRIISGIVDTDLLKTEINTPFVFKKGWTGILEKGTPMFQIIPFERNSWKAKYSFITETQHSYNVSAVHTKLKDSYKKYFREKRSYT